MRCTWIKAIVIVILYHISFSALSNPTDSLYRVVYETHDMDKIEELIPTYQQQATDEALAKLYFLVGWKYEQIEDLGKSFDCYKKSPELYYSNSDFTRAEKCLDNLGRLALRLHLYQKAYEYYHQAWELNKQLGDKKEIALSLYDIGLSLSKTHGSKREAIWYLTQSVDILEQIEDSYLLSEVYIRMGMIHRNMEAYGSAMDCYSLALKYSPDSDEVLAQVLNNQSYLLMRQGDYQGALALQDSAIMIKRKLGNDRFLMTSLNTLGVIKYKLGDYDASYAALMEAFSINVSQKDLKQGTYDNLKESYKYLDSTSVAMDDRYKLINSGIAETFLSKQEQIVDQQQAYRVRDMVYQGELLAAKEDLLGVVKQRNLIIYGLLFCLLVIIIWNIIQAIKRNKKKQRELREMEAVMRKVNMPIPS